MKRALVASILGLVVSLSANSSQGIGVYNFANYIPVNYMPIKYFGSSAPVATSNVHVDLLYYLGSTADPTLLTDLHLSIPVDPSMVDLLGNAGYFQTTAVLIPDYFYGPVTFMARAWDITTGASYATAGLRGQSFLWQESFLNVFPDPGQYPTLPGPDGAALLYLVPEPSTLALAGLAAVAFRVMRRRSETPN